MKPTIYEMLHRIEERQPPLLPEEVLPPNFSALDYFRAVLHGKVAYDPYRFKAAKEIIAYEMPKLSVSVVNHRGLGDAIDAARARHIAPQTAKVIEHERERER